MDLFKRELFHDIGPGGVKCNCCTLRSLTKNKRNTRRRNKIIMNKKVRARLKVKIFKEIVDILG